MSELRVRDHSQPCKHGEQCSHSVTGEIVQVGQLPAVCPGGKEIVLHPADPYPTQPGRTRYWREERVVEE